MKRSLLWIRLTQLMVVAVVGAGLTLGLTGTASAAVLTCNKGAGAPSLTLVSGGTGLRANYYHSCNMNPQTAGASTMVASVGVQMYTTAWVSPPGSGFSTGNVPAQTTAAYSATLNNFSGSHYFRAHMNLVLIGNFSYGSVPGCSRTSSTTVTCDWYGPQQFYGG